MILPAHALSLLALGAAGGFLSGLLGLGGGIIFVPALFYVLTTTGTEADAAMHTAVGTSMALVLATSASSAFWHNRKGAVDWSLIRRWAPATMLGVVAGMMVALAVPGVGLKRIFSVIVLLVAIYMVTAKEKPEAAPSAPHRLPVLAQQAVMALIGGLAALIGVGGAIVSVPFMHHVGVPIRAAVGTGAALAVAAALPGTAGYLIEGYVDYMALAIVLPAAMLLSPLGVRASHGLPRPVLRRIFAVVLVLVSLRMFFS